MRILALDPSLTCTGWAVLEFSRGSVELLDKGSIKTSAGDSLGARLTFLYFAYINLCKDFKVDELVVEDIHVSPFAEAVKKQFSLQGCIELCAYLYTENITSIKATTISKLVTGNGKPPKGERKKILRENLSKFIGEQKYKNYDESDACGIGIAFGIQRGLC